MPMRILIHVALVSMAMAASSSAPARAPDRGPADPLADLATSLSRQLGTTFKMEGSVLVIEHDTNVGKAGLRLDSLQVQRIPLARVRIESTTGESDAPPALSFRCAAGDCILQRPARGTWMGVPQASVALPAQDVLAVQARLVRIQHRLWHVRNRPSAP